MSTTPFETTTPFATLVADLKVWTQSCFEDSTFLNAHSCCTISRRVWVRFHRAHKHYSQAEANDLAALFDHCAEAVESAVCSLREQAHPETDRVGDYAKSIRFRAELARTLPDHDAIERKMADREKAERGMFTLLPTQLATRSVSG